MGYGVRNFFKGTFGFTLKCRFNFTNSKMHLTLRVVLDLAFSLFFPFVLLMKKIKKKKRTDFWGSGKNFPGN